MSVYFIREKCYRGRVKIGYSQSPDKRLKELQTGNPNQLELFAQIESGDEQTEKEIHNYFSNKHIHGEWYDLSSEDINSICRKYSDIHNVEVKDIGTDDDAKLTGERCIQVAHCHYEPDDEKVREIYERHTGRRYVKPHNLRICDGHGNIITIELLPNKLDSQRLMTAYSNDGKYKRWVIVWEKYNINYICRWYKNGKKQSEDWYDHECKRHGKCMWWSKDGTLYHEEEYIHGLTKDEIRHAYYIEQEAKRKEALKKRDNFFGIACVIIVILIFLAIIGKTAGFF